jgi:hypothetical protein
MFIVMSRRRIIATGVQASLALAGEACTPVCPATRSSLYACLRDIVIPNAFELIAGILAVVISRLIYKPLLKWITYENIIYSDFYLIDKLHRHS